MNRNMLQTSDTATATIVSQQPGDPYRGSPGEVYERLLAPAIFAPWTRDIVVLAAPQPGER